MTTKVIMPQMGESVFEGTLTKWLKKVGDSVAQDEPLFEISTDKVDSEIPSPASGILQAILVPEGSTVQINTVVAIINGAEARPAEAQESQPSMTEEAVAKSETEQPSISSTQMEPAPQQGAKAGEERAHELATSD